MTGGIHFGDPRREPSDPRPRVYGFVRAFDPYQLALEWRTVEGFCRRMGFDLIRIIEDPCESDKVVPCRSFLELACALELEPVRGVVLPELVHLSPDEHVQSLRWQWIRSLDRQVFVVPKDITCFRETGA